MADEHQSIEEQISQLQEYLQSALSERRQRFFEACTYWGLTINKGKFECSEADAAGLDRALDLFDLASTLVSEIRSDLRDKEKMRGFTTKRELMI